MRVPIYTLISALLAAAAVAQTAPPPDCVVSANAAILNGNGNVPVSPPAAAAYYDNRGNNCTLWSVEYQAAAGLSGYTVAFQSAAGALTPGSFGAFAGNALKVSTSFGTANHGEALYSNVGTITVDTPFVRFHSAGASGTGNILVTIQGWKSNWTNAGGGGGGGGGSGCPGTTMTPCVVVGDSADAAPIAGAPVRVAGNDGTDTRSIHVDSAGNQMVIGPAAAGVAPVGNPVQVGGTDGTDIRAMATDSSGHPIIVGDGVAGTPAGGVASVQGVSGGTPIPVTPTIPAGLGTFNSGQQAVTNSDAALATNTAKNVCIASLITSTVEVYVGTTGVTTGTGFQLSPGQGACWSVNNTNLIHVIATGAGATVSWTLTN